ncbi:MAG: hypothetical protein GXY74_15580 [Phycisphaerae bacterium]|nr:hypothetical protein [Phycisphaerae bacterium]
MATYKSLTIAMRLDTADVSAGANRAIAEQQRIAAETKRINSDLATYRRALRQRGDEMGAGDRAGLEQRVAAAEERKATLAESRAAQRALHERLDAAKAARAAEAAEYQKAAAERRAMADRLYAATHTQQQVELRNLRHHYAQQRLMHRDNARMLSMIDRAYAAERQQIMARALPETTAGGISGATRTLIGTNVRFGASTALGSMGGPLGGIASAALMPGMAGLGGITAGVMVLAAIYQNATRRAEELRQVQREHAAAVYESARAMEEFTAHYASANEAAWSRMAGESEGRSKSALQALEDHRASAGVWDRFSGAFRETEKLLQSRWIEEGLENLRREEIAAKERTIGIAQRREAMQIEAQSAGLAAMQDGLEKERLVRSAKWLEAERKIRQEQETRIRNLQNANGIEEGMRQTRIAEERGFLAEQLAHLAALQQAEEKAAEAKRQRANASAIADTMRDLERQLLVARGTSELRLKIIEMGDAMRRQGAGPEDVATAQRWMREAAQAGWQRDLARQMAEYAAQIDLATGKINEMEAAMRRFRAAQPDADEATQAVAREAQAMAEKARLAEWSRQQAESLKTEEDRLREYKAELDKARAAGYLTREQEIGLLAARLPERQVREENYVVRGQFGGDARDLQVGGVSRLEKVAQHGERTVRLLEEMLTELRGGAGVPQFN